MSTEGTTNPRYDAADVKAAARGRWAEILSAAGIPRESLDGRHHTCPRPGCGGADRFRFYRDDAGGAICNVCLKSAGDGLAVVQWYRGCSFPEALQFVAEQCGVQPIAGEAKPKTPNEILAAVAREKRVKPESLQQFGGVVEAGAVRFTTWDAKGNASLPFRIAPGSGKRSKGMFDSSAKSAGKKAGVFLPVVDGKPRLPQAGETWHIVEGVKDSAALHELGMLAMGMPTCRLNQKFVPLLRGVNVVFVPDRDTAGDDGSQQNARKVFRSAASTKTAVLPAEMKPSDGADVRDILAMPDGERLVRDAIEQAQPWQPELPDDGEVKPEIKVGPDEHRMTVQTITALAERGCLYQRAGALAEIRDNPKPPPGIIRPNGGIRAARPPRPRLRELISQTVRFVKRRKTDDGDEWTPTHVPQPVVDQIDVRGEWPGMPSLEGVVTSPQFLADGSILAVPGYHANSGLYFATDCTFPAVAELPTKAEAIEASKSLLEVVADFPLDDVGRSSWLAFVLTGAARFAIDGPAPLGAFDANVRASGKSKLADSIGVIHSGRDLPRTTFSTDDAETRKVITAMLLAGGEPYALFDNVAGPLGCPSLDAVLTSTTWTDRVLGVSQMTAAMPATTIWLATGNNLQFAADTARRTLRIRIVSPLEKPEERTGFQHPNLLAWVKQERGRLAAAAVTILRAWHCARRPDMGLAPWGSFEAWSDIIRNAIVWLDLPDPGSTRQEVQRESDREAMLLRQLLDAWEQADPQRHGLFVVDALAMAEKGNEPALSNVIAELTPASGKVSARGVGMRLHHLRGRVCDGRYFDKHDVRQGALWVVKSAEVGESPLIPCTTNTTSATTFSPPACEVGTHHISSTCTQENKGRPLGTSGASPASGADCDHSPAAGLERGNELHCRACDKLLGYLDEVS